MNQDQAVPRLTRSRGGIPHLPHLPPAGHPKTNYPNCDASPTKSLLIERGDSWYEMSFGKRPEHEFYNIVKDPGCVNNLAASSEYEEQIVKLRGQMEEMLKKEGDLRALGKPEWYDTIKYVGNHGHGWKEEKHGVVPKKP